MPIIQSIKRNAKWIVIILSFFVALFLNELNLNRLDSSLKRENQTVITNDDISYIAPPTNYLNNNEWKNNSPGKQSYFARSPGYGLFYLTLLKVFNYPSALKWMKYAQLLLFSLSIYCLYFIAHQLLKNKLITLITISIYGLTPFAIGFLYYTLTEGITPAFVIFFIYFLLKAFNQDNQQLKKVYYTISSILFAYLFITRPVLGIIGILLPAFIIQDYWKNSAFTKLKNLFIYGLISISLMTAWQVRNYQLAEQYVGLHPIYYTEGNSIYRPPFKAFWNLVLGWGEEGHIAHSYIVPFWLAAIEGDTSRTHIDNIIAHFPNNVTTHLGKQQLFSVFRKYQQSILYQKTYYDKELPMPKEIPEIEKEVVAGFESLTTQFKSRFWFQYHVLSPLKVFKVMAFHSNLSLSIFQKKHQDSMVVKFIKLIFYIIHSLSFFAIFINLFIIKKPTLKFVFGVVPILYIFYLCYFQRGVEERYTLPLLPLLVLGLANIILYLYNSLKPKITK